MNQVPIHDFHISKKHLGSFFTGTFEAPFTTLLQGKGWRLMATAHKISYSLLHSYLLLRGNIVQGLRVGIVVL